MNVPKLPWNKIIGEGALIIVAVYLAIFLEGVSQDRVARQSAHTALAQMLEEMREDRADVNEIRAEQFIRDKQYQALEKWFSNPDSIPLDSMKEAIDAIFLENRTLYPRRSAWATMVAAGQLSKLDAPDLVARLGNFYESRTARIIDNGNDFDEGLNDLGRNSVPKVWDSGNARLLTTDARELATVRNQFRYIHIGWNLWYLDALDSYGKTLDSLIFEIETYLEKNNFEMKPVE
ncbi:DUF6090 family protein [Thalassotalea nanhaiensis]|uniref:DUF6090 family protein n=1 Tax=Thalassotalea nanhaiensis TaxID=3065648 RepID=A0ABY9TFD6_9GAMM|nr:DUF6090 family protein [Colwelliaceae bacterium SQ345]